MLAVSRFIVCLFVLVTTGWCSGNWKVIKIWPAVCKATQLWCRMDICIFSFDGVVRTTSHYWTSERPSFWLTLPNPRESKQAVGVFCSPCLTGLKYHQSTLGCCYGCSPRHSIWDLIFVLPPPDFDPIHQHTSTTPGPAFRSICQAYPQLGFCQGSVRPDVENWLDSGEAYSCCLQRVVGTLTRVVTSLSPKTEQGSIAELYPLVFLKPILASPIRFLPRAQQEKTRVYPPLTFTHIPSHTLMNYVPKVVKMVNFLSFSYKMWPSCSSFLCLGTSPLPHLISFLILHGFDYLSGAEVRRTLPGGQWPGPSRGAWILSEVHRTHHRRETH